MLCGEELAREGPGAGSSLPCSGRTLLQGSREAELLRGSKHLKHGGVGGPCSGGLVPSEQQPARATAGGAKPSPGLADDSPDARPCHSEKFKGTMSAERSPGHRVPTLVKPNLPPYLDTHRPRVTTPPPPATGGDPEITGTF